MCMSVSRKDFEVKINEVTENLWLSYSYLKICEKMFKDREEYLPQIASLKEYPPQIASLEEYSPRLLIMALYEAGTLRLTRAYDQNKQNLGLLKIIGIVKSHYKIWDLQDIDTNQLQEDKEFVTREKNELVDRLIQLRDKAISHTQSSLHCQISDSEIAEILKDGFTAMEKNYNEILGKPRPSLCELFKLTNNGVEICNRYRQKIGLTPIELKSEGID